MELVRQFVGLHDHLVGVTADLEPSPQTVRKFFEVQGLVPGGERLMDGQVNEALALHGALRAKVHANLGEPVPPEAIATIDRLVLAAGLRPRFRADGPPELEPTTGGFEGAVGWLLAITFLAELDGSWSHLKECASDECSAIFFDRSKNHSARWCSMRVCGNRAKVRAFRERHGAGVADA